MNCQLDAIVDGNLNWSFLTAEDLQPVAELIAALEYFDDPVEHRDLRDLVEQYQSGEAQIGVVGRDKGGTVVAYAWNRGSQQEGVGSQVWMSTGVHPAWRHRKIGRKLMEWSVEAALSWHRESPIADHPLWVGYLVDEKFTGLRNVLGELGFEPQRYFFDMHRQLDGSELPELKVHEGIQLTPYEPWMSESIRLLHNEVVCLLAGGRGVGRAEWEASLTRQKEAPNMSWVAVVGDSLVDPHCLSHGDFVGYALNSVLRERTRQQKFTEGWTERLGVCPRWRGLGLGIALLVASMHTFAEAGFDSAGLGADTDTATDGESLREACGYEMDDQVILYGRTYLHDEPGLVP